MGFSWAMSSQNRFCWSLLILLASFAMAGCGESKPKVDVNAQIQALSGTTEAKQDALTALATVGPAALPGLDKFVPLLKDEDHVVRRLAAYAIGSIGPAAKSAVPALKEALASADRDFATSLINAIRDVDPVAGKSLGGE